MLYRETHRMILFQILKDIFESDIGKHLAFKGGTACYFFHNLDRFSTDLDFDLLTDIDIDQQLEDIIKKYGSLKKRNKIILSYKNDGVNIKIDISRKIWKNNIYEIRNFYGTDINIQTKDTIFSNKLVALYERNANRDIYDVYFFLKNNFDINHEIIYERTNLSIRDFLEKIIYKLKKLPKNYNILDGLGEVLDHKQKQFVKDRLLLELVGMLEFKKDFT